MRLPRPATLSAPLLFGIPTLLCLVLSVGWWKAGAAVPIALLADSLTGRPVLTPSSAVAPQAAVLPVGTGVGREHAPPPAR